MELIEFQYIILKITAFIFKQKADTMSVNNMNEPTDPLDHVGDRWAWLFGESPGASITKQLTRRRRWRQMGVALRGIN